MPHKTLSRRSLLGSAAAAPLASLDSGSASAQAPVSGQSPLIVRQSSPENLEFPFHTLNSYLTPVDQFYVRSHFAVPTIDASKWSLSIEGAVERPITITYDELRSMPNRTLISTMECAGNGRVFLTPAARGVQWEWGGVSTAEWVGVPLAAVLEKAGLKPNAVDIILEGADSGELKDPPKPAGVIHFARSIPLSRAQNPDVMLAFRMNGKDLTPAHGFPVRAVVPGWYGMASIKWITRIVVSTEPFGGFYQTIDYAIWEVRNGLPTRVAVTETVVKSAISRPMARERVRAGSTYHVHGAAWSGDADVVKVEVSSDGGKSWLPAHLNDAAKKYTWRRWSFDWQVPSAPGRHGLWCRATDSRGYMQPMERDGQRDNTMINHVLPVWVEVEA